MNTVEMYEGVAKCPNGCGFDELEVGTNQCGFMAILGSPQKYIRCGKCMFNNENTASLAFSMEDVKEKWNEAVKEETGLRSAKP